MQVKDNSTTLGLYQYNGLHWRTIKQGDTGGSAGHDQKREFIYSASWQPIQEEIDDYTNNGSPDGSGGNPNVPDRRAQTVWGLRYIDDAVLRRVNSNPGSDNDYLDSGDGTFYHITDAQFSTVAMIDKTAKLMERVGYNAYGTAAHRWPGDVDNSNASTSADETAIDNLADMNGSLGVDITSGSYDVACDLNRDGVVNSTDTGQWSSVFGGARATLGQGISTTFANGGTDNQYGYDGYVFNYETRAYLSRFRWYEPLLGRWWERDPFEYVDGQNLYEYAKSAPNTHNDALGACTICVAGDGPWIPTVPSDPIRYRIQPQPPGRIGTINSPGGNAARLAAEVAEQIALILERLARERFAGSVNQAMKNCSGKGGFPIPRPGRDRHDPMGFGVDCIFSPCDAAKRLQNMMANYWNDYQTFNNRSWFGRTHWQKERLQGYRDEVRDGAELYDFYREYLKEVAPQCAQERKKKKCSEEPPSRKVTM